MKLKKLFLYPILICTFIFSACNKSEITKPDLNYDFSFQAKITYETNNYEILGQSISNQWEFTYLSPAELEGMNVIFTNDNAIITFQGLENEYLRENLSDGNICKILSSCFDFLKNNDDLNYTKEDGIIIGKGTFQGGDLIVSYDENNLPAKIQIGENFKISISNFKKQ